jgi:hypothetical protein
MWLIEARFKSKKTGLESSWIVQEVPAYSDPERAQKAVDFYSTRNTLSEWRMRPYAPEFPPETGRETVQ